jgi:DNA polymerase III sliding clamp (beta) subunit (PCNA family)
MKPIIIPTTELKRVLIGMGKVVPRKSTLKVVEHVKFTRLPNGDVNITGTDLDTFATYFVDTDAITEVADEPIEFLVPLEKLKAIVKTAKGDIALSLEANSVILAHTSIGEQRINSLPANEYVPLPRMESKEIKTFALPEALRDVLFKEAPVFASCESTRYVINSILLEVGEGGVTHVVSTDGRRLFDSNSITLPGAPKSNVIIPASCKILQWDGWWQNCSVVLEQQPVVKDGKGDYVYQGWLRFTSNHWSIMVKSIDATYPTYRAVIPPDGQSNTALVVPENKLQSLIAAINFLPVTEKADSIRLDMRDNKLQVWGGEPLTHVPIEGAQIVGKPMQAAFNPSYIVDALKLGLNKFYFVDELTPVVMQVGGKRVITMPMRLS